MQWGLFHLAQNKHILHKGIHFPAVIKLLLNWMIRRFLQVKFQLFIVAQTSLRVDILFFFAALNLEIFSSYGIPSDAQGSDFKTWIMIIWPKHKYILKLVIIMPKINWRFITEPLVLVQARTNELNPLVKLALLALLWWLREWLNHWYWMDSICWTSRQEYKELF